MFKSIKEIFKYRKSNTVKSVVIGNGVLIFLLTYQNEITQTLDILGYAPQVGVINMLKIWLPMLTTLFVVKGRMATDTKPPIDERL